jgi:polyhydroxyalkanoate synthesis regulator phasin
VHVDPLEVINEYREHLKNMTDDLMMHKAAVKSLEKQVSSLESRIAELQHSESD